MRSVSHKWLGDCWRMLGDFRQARHHHAKHLELNSPAVFDLSGSEGTRNEQQVKALFRQENVKGSAAAYAMDRIKQMSQHASGEHGGSLSVKPAHLASVVQVENFCPTYALSLPMLGAESERAWHARMRAGGAIVS